MVENSLMRNSPSPNYVSTIVLLFVFIKSFVEICLKIYLSNITYTSIIKLYDVCFQLHFCTEQIMAVLWSLTCAAATLSLLQENNLSNSIPQGKMSDKSS